jgi:flagellar biosynthesis protein FliP
VTARRTVVRAAALAFVLLAALWLAPVASAQTTEVKIAEPSSSAVQMLLLFAFLSVIPGLVFTVTAFPRILIVLSMLRQAIGTPSTPPNQVLTGIAIFLTAFVMAPTINKVRSDAVAPYLANKINMTVALQRAEQPVREFMFKQTRPEHIALFMKMAKKERPKTKGDVPTLVLAPAFITSELKTAFQIGFLIFLPFLIIDLVVASTLLSAGMMMLPPPLISLPFKVLLFVLVDGWSLVFQAIVNSFNV